MTIVSLVYAQSRNGVIGADGGLPWRIPSDLRRFKEITMGKPVIMGRKTWDSLPRKPLPGRKNIVVTRQRGFQTDGAEVANSADEAMRLAGDVPEVCVIGGGEIYFMFLPIARRVYLTEVDVDVEGDTLAPKLDPKQWREVVREPEVRGEGDSAAWSVRVLERVYP
jgi:dihydrofolate reductase